MSSFQFLQIYTSNVSANAKNVYQYLERHGARRGICFHSTATIANNLKLSRRTVNRVLNELESQGFILRTHRYRKNGAKSSNQYEILK